MVAADFLGRHVTCLSAHRYFYCKEKQKTTNLRYLLEIVVGLTAFLRRLQRVLVVVHKGLVNSQLAGLKQDGKRDKSEKHKGTARNQKV